MSLAVSLDDTVIALHARANPSILPLYMVVNKKIQHYSIENLMNFSYNKDSLLIRRGSNRSERVVAVWSPRKGCSN